MTRAMRMSLLAMVALVVAGGCTRPLKERIIMLEDANRSLGLQVEETITDLEACRNENNKMRNDLLAARNEANQLRTQLAAMPEPEPAPVEAEGWVPVEGGSMIAIQGDILFNAGSTTLLPAARRKLDAIVSNLISTYAGRDVLVLGHTDSQPIAKSGFDDNYQLSTERSLAVVRYLREHGVSADRLVAGGCGENRPRVPNTSYDNMTMNRRVEIFAITLQ